MLKRIVLTVGALALLPAVVSFSQSSTAPSTQPAGGEKRVTSSGLTIIELAPPDGARLGDLVWVHYTGRLADGTKFDSSYDRNDAIPITLGEGSVIPGWEEGLLGMQVGEKRQLIVPPQLGFGAQGRGKIPPNATLTFDIELMGIRRR